MNQNQTEQSPRSSSDSDSAQYSDEQLSVCTSFTFDQEVQEIIEQNIDYVQYLINSMTDIIRQIRQALTPKRSEQIPSQISNELLQILRLERGTSIDWLEFQVRTLTQLANEIALLLGDTIIVPQIYISSQAIDDDSQTMPISVAHLDTLDMANQQINAVMTKIQILGTRIKHYLNATDQN